jgi:hypothetical protein
MDPVIDTRKLDQLAYVLHQFRIKDTSVDQGSIDFYKHCFEGEAVYKASVMASR